MATVTIKNVSSAPKRTPYGLLGPGETQEVPEEYFALLGPGVFTVVPSALVAEDAAGPSAEKRAVRRTTPRRRKKRKTEEG